MQWLEFPGRTGRAIDDPADWIHIEPFEALAHQVRVVPLPVGEAPFPTADDLPERLVDLARRQYVKLDPADGPHRPVPEAPHREQTDVRAAACVPTATSTPAHATREHGGSGTGLPSAQRDYHFLLAATVLWRPAGPHGMSHPRPAQLAIDAIRELATRFVERESPADSDLVAPRLAADLSFPLPDRTAHLEVRTQDAVLSIPDDDRRRLDKLAAVRKDEEVWEHERAYERNERAYLREDVLSSTGSAVVWWLARDVTRVQETVDLIGTLAKLVDAAQDREVEPVFHTFVNGLTDPSLRATTSNDFMDQLITESLPNGSEPERAELADRLPRMSPTPVHPNGQVEPDARGTSPRPPDNPGTIL